MDTPADELFFGGAAGGGKSDLLLGLAITQHRRTLILRRTASYLKDLSFRVQEICGSKTFRASGHGGTMVLPGRIIELNGCEHEKDREHYQGNPHDLLAFDEISHFSKTQYEFIIGWNRTTSKDQRCRVVCAGNPPTNPEGRWVVEAWAPWLDEQFHDPAKPGELRWYSTIEGKTNWKRSGEPFEVDGEIVKPKSRTFIPSFLSDNPILEATDYRSKLQAMPEPYRSMFLYGDMNAGQEDNPSQVIPTAWVQAAQQRWQAGPPEGFSLNCMGVDVARGGSDKTVISMRYGYWFAPLLKYPGKSTPDGPEVANRVIAIHSDKADVNIDVIGIGSSAYDCLKGTLGRIVHGINNAASAPDNMTDKSGMFRFVNLRAASYWALREALDPNGPQKLALPQDSELLSDLCAARYRVMASGIIVEPKDDIIKRLGRSPDCGDAVVLAHWLERKKEFWLA